MMYQVSRYTLERSKGYLAGVPLTETVATAITLREAHRLARTYAPEIIYIMRRAYSRTVAVPAKLVEIMNRCAALQETDRIAKSWEGRA